MPFEPLTAISPVDGRYRDAAAPLADYFSEFALIKYRVFVECEYLIALSKAPKLGVRKLSDKEIALLRKIEAISIEDARLVKKFEKKGHGNVPATNHDVKAVEYFIKQKIDGTSLADVSEWIHFALTSEDVNSVSYGLMLRDFFEHIFLGGPLWDIERGLTALAKTHAGTAMLARTHGQSASPTTFGKEMKVFLQRLHRQVDAMKTGSILVKWGGATGNWNAHAVAAPDVDWVALARKFVEGLNAAGKGKKHFMRVELNEFTAQIEPHDTYAEFFDHIRRINTILIDFSQDIWRYISDGWITQKPTAGEVGSSAMPHKVNPIDFENAEGNLGIANALFEHFSRKLPVSRLQRDLSDSTVLRTFGVALAHSYIAYGSLVKGLGKIEVNKRAMLEELQAHPEVLAEALQTALRREGVAVPYEQLRDLTRGKQITLEDLARFVDSLDIRAPVKKRLRELRPENYVGLAAKLAKQ
jgi:adenylosuccinate lyase